MTALLLPFSVAVATEPRRRCGGLSLSPGDSVAPGARYSGFERCTRIMRVQRSAANAALRFENKSSDSIKILASHILEKCWRIKFQFILKHGNRQLPGPLRMLFQIYSVSRTHGLAVLRQCPDSSSGYLVIPGCRRMHREVLVRWRWGLHVIMLLPNQCFRALNTGD